MSGSVGVERIGREVFPGRQETETVAGHDPVQICFFGTDRASTFADAVGNRTNHFIRDAPAMASAAISGYVVGLVPHNKSGFIAAPFFEPLLEQSDATWPQTTHLPPQPDLSYNWDDAGF